MQHLGLLTLLILIVGLTFTVTLWRGGLHLTFSQHAATSRWAKIFYALLFLVTLPMLMLFFVAWFIPTNNLPNAFLWFATIASIFQIVCTWFPEDGGRKTTIHRVLTAISGIALLPLMVILAISTNISMNIRNAAWIGLLAMIALLCIALRNQKGYRYTLFLQIGYYTIFFIIILLVTYF
jgi:hypothetical protein